MASNATLETKPSKDGKADKSPKPPDEQFWVRYSPNHEFSLSTLGSVLMHVIIYGAAAFLITSVFWPEDKAKPVQIDTVTEDAGGGGNRNGTGNSAGVAVPTQRTEQVQKPDDMVAQEDPLALKDPKIEQAKINTPRIDVPDKKIRYLPDDKADPINRLRALKNEIAALPTQGREASQGQEGPGEGGGAGSGIGKGTGEGAGNGNKPLSKQERRQLRRVIRYSVGDGDLYRRQLAGLGIVLAVPEMEDGHKVYRVYRDLSHVPPEGKIEDVYALHRSYWVDDNPDTVALLAQALHIRKPEAFLALLPQDLEADMLKKELNYQHVKDENQIKETVFEVVPTRSGYHIVVTSQKLY